MVVQIEIMQVLLIWIAWITIHGPANMVTPAESRARLGVTQTTSHDISKQERCKQPLRDQLSTPGGSSAVMGAWPQAFWQKVGRQPEGKPRFGSKKI